MKKSIYIKALFFISLIILSACRKSSVSLPEFDVNTDATTFKVGQPVTFNITGNAQNVVFWSGEKGHKYENKDRTEEQGVTQTMQFTSLAGAGTQNSNLSVLVSKNFDGTYLAADIAKATWTDITTRAVLSSNATAAAGASTASGAVNIADFASADNVPVYFAFHYLAPSNTLKPRQWTISSFVVTNTLKDGTVNNVIASLANAGFHGVDIQNPTYQWAFAPSAASATSMTVAPGNIGDPVNEDWAISPAVKLNTVSLTDYGVSILSLTTLSPPKSYAYTFNTAGTYNVTFNAFNENDDDKKAIVKSITITIQP